MKWTGEYLVQRQISEIRYKRVHYSLLVPARYLFKLSFFKNARKYNICALQVFRFQGI